MTDQQLVPIEAQNQIQEAIALCKSVVNITINNNDEYEKNCELTRGVRTFYKNLDGTRKLIKEPYKAKADEVDKVFREPLRSLKNVERKLSMATSNYEIAIENEQRRIAEEKRKQLEAEKKTPKSAKDIEIQTDYYEYYEPPSPPRIAGKQSIPKWTAEITDKAAFLKYVVENGELLLVDVNIKMLNKMAQDALGELDIPGVKCNKEMVSRYT